MRQPMLQRRPEFQRPRHSVTGVSSHSERSTLVILSRAKNLDFRIDRFDEKGVDPSLRSGRRSALTKDLLYN